MFTSWDGWRLPHVRWIGGSAYLVGAIAAFVLGAGIASALIGAVVALVVVCALEGWARFRHEPVIRDDPSRYP